MMSLAAALCRSAGMGPTRCFSTLHRSSLHVRPIDCASTTKCTFSSTSGNSKNERQASNGEDCDDDDIERVVIKDLGDGIKNVILSRPSKLNSLDMRMFESIAGAASKLRDDTSARAIIVSGKGKAFCTGLDVKSVVTKQNPLKSVERLLERPSGYERYPEATSLGNLAQDVGYLWRDIPVPVIASLHGMCFGGGMYVTFSGALYPS